MSGVTDNQHLTPTVPVRRRRTGLLVTLLVLGGLVVGAAVASGVLFAVGKLGAQTFTAHGTVTVAVSCSTPGYEDISAGTQVVLTDEAQKVISVGVLSPRADWNHPTWCEFTFTLPDVPAGKRFYGITVSHRGTVEYTEAQLRHGPEMTLGG